MKSRRFSNLGFAVCLMLGACGDGEADKTDAATNPSDGGQPFVEPVGPWFACGENDEVGATVVTAHNKVDHYINPDSNPNPGNYRNVDAEVDFPSGDWGRIYMRVELECPADGQCDVWDRAGSISLVEDESETVKKRLELARFMTPYHRGFCFVAELTDLSSRLTGHKKIRSFIDTWVSNDDPNNGHGWRITTKFIFRAGQRDAATYASEIIPLWNNQAEERLITIGDPAQPVAAEMPTRTVTIPADATAVKLRYIVTGHGQGGGDNCAEFCELAYQTKIGSASVSVKPWRDDCNVNPVSPQDGTWPYARAGWCPGSFVAPTIVDITDKATPGTDVALSSAIVDATGQDWVNTCRPGAGDENNHCMGCLSGANAPNNCDYNYNGHTQPEARISAQLLIYR